MMRSVRSLGFVGAAVALAGCSITDPPRDVGRLAPTKAESAADYAVETGARAVVIVSKGQVILERYAAGGGAEVAEPIASGTKSFTCALAAAAEADGLLSLDARAVTWLTEWAADGAKASIRLINLLSLSSGLANDGEFGARLNTVDTYAQAIQARSILRPDTAVIYGPNGFQAFLAAFKVAAKGREPVDYLQTRIFDPIGVRPGGWRRDIAGNANFGGGAAFRARDWAIYGQLILQEGEWQGGRVLPAALVRRCSKPASAAFLGYGVGFWLNGPVGGSYQPGEDRVPMPEAVRARWLQGGKYAPDVPDDMFFASGAGSMKMFILPSHDLVVVKLGGESDDNRFLGLLVGARAPGSIGEHGGRT